MLSYVKVVIACSLGLVFSLSAAARPVSIHEVRDEFAKRGAGDVQMAFLNGHPVVAGELEGQSFYAILGNCDEEEKLCTSLRLRSCRRLDPMPRLEVLELANDFNAQKHAGVAIAEKGEIAPSICVEQSFSFPNTLDFGLREVFEWGETLEDFADYFDQVERSKLAASVMNGTMR